MFDCVTNGNFADLVADIKFIGSLELNNGLVRVDYSYLETNFAKIIILLQGRGRCLFFEQEKAESRPELERGPKLTPCSM